MAKRRTISENINVDAEFNSLEFATSQNVYIRMLAVSDDYGVIPADDYTLPIKLNCKSSIAISGLKEITEKKFGVKFNYNGKTYFMFKARSFDDFQSHILARRTKSEYLKIPKAIMESEELIDSIELENPEDFDLIKRHITVKKFNQLNSVDEILFEELYKAYPHTRRVSRAKALDSYIKIKPDKELFASIMKGLEQHKRSIQWNKDKGQYIPLITTWLNQKRWTEPLAEETTEAENKDMKVSNKFKVEGQ